MTMKVQSTRSLFKEMRAVARGERPAPRDAAAPSVESAEALVRILTRENRHLLKVIRDQKPQSVAELARLTDRAEPNLLRTLAKLEAAGFVEMRSVANRRVPVSKVSAVRVLIDPYTMTDHVEFSPAKAS
jgi:predicted transcriptional regulator